MSENTLPARVAKRLAEEENLRFYQKIFSARELEELRNLNPDFLRADSVLPDDHKEKSRPPMALSA